MKIDCETDCTGAEVTKNAVHGNVDGSASFRIDSDAAGLVVSKNQMRDGSGDGFVLNLTDATVSRNTVRVTGDELGDHDCFEVAGDDSTLDRNTGEQCERDGFRVSGADNTLTGNRVKRSGSDGFRVVDGAVGTRLEKNRADDTTLTGFRVEDGSASTPGAMTTELVGNRARGSRFDLCDEGANTTLTDNDFETTLAVNNDDVKDCPTF